MAFVALPDDVELPHQPGDDPQWQESVVLGWADPSKNIGGFIRIGHQPHLGLTRSCFGVTMRDGLNYVRTAQDLPLLPGDRENDTFSADRFQSASFGVRTSRWRASDEHVDLDLTVSDVHAPCDFWELTGLRIATADVMAANHLQVGGTFTGAVRVGDRASERVSGFTYRDHSWGPRHLDSPNADMYGSWWLVGSLGADFSFGFGGGTYRSGLQHRFGYIVKDGIADTAAIEDEAVVMAIDGLSNRGGSVTVFSEKFGRMTFVAEGYGNIRLEMGKKHFEMCMPGTIRCGDRVGGGLIDTILNPRNGVDRPTYIASGKLDNGLYRSRNGLNVPD